ncbi:unnamed protein product [Porites lobata]|uniref:Uncharacterized protein n=1 Tax=Porites lobata TaxID=104759 RepID=A0ABN8QJ52_9CNID|nr:unnamed protein product [Porites lobata]
MENVSDRGPLGRHHKKRTSTVNHKRERKIVIKKQSAPPQNYLTGTPNRVRAGMTNVKQPGGSLTAAVGDGITDDKSAIQAIVNQAPISTIKKVFFPASWCVPGQR